MMPTFVNTFVSISRDEFLPILEFDKLGKLLEKINKLTRISLVQGIVIEVRL